MLKRILMISLSSLALCACYHHVSRHAPLSRCRQMRHEIATMTPQHRRLGNYQPTPDHKARLLREYERANCAETAR